MQSIRHPFTATTGAMAIQLLLITTWLVCGQAFALETDRQKPLEVNANSTDGTLGDGVTTLRGDVDIRQGTLHITADQAEVIKADGKVQKVSFLGQPASLQQEIEEQGLVQATANSIEYQVATGLVTLNGNADVKHPQYQISGDLLTYDLNVQHFKGNGDDGGNGRIHIRLDPEVLDDPNFSTSGKKSGEGKNNKASETTSVTPEDDASQTGQADASSQTKQPASEVPIDESEVAPEYDAPFADDANPDDDFSDPDDSFDDLDGNTGKRGDR